MNVDPGTFEIYNMSHHHIVLAIDLHGRKYPDVSATALLSLRQIERLRRNPGYEEARQWGDGPHHQELQRLGLATIGQPEYSGGTRPVDMTDDGRIVAELLEGLCRGVTKPVKCRVCGQLCLNEVDSSLCERCS